MNASTNRSKLTDADRQTLRRVSAIYRSGQPVSEADHAAYAAAEARLAAQRKPAKPVNAWYDLPIAARMWAGDAADLAKRGE